MSVEAPAPQVRQLLDRVVNLIMKPTAELTKIEAERPTISSLYLGYVAPLAAIPAVAGMLGAFVFGIGGHGYAIALSPLKIIAGAINAYVFLLAAPLVMAAAIYFLAEVFASKKDWLAALKLAVYSTTPVWLIGIVGLFPPLGALWLGSLYALFLLYRGLPILLKTPIEQALPYTAAVVVVALVVIIVFFMLSMCAMGGGI